LIKIDNQKKLILIGRIVPGPADPRANFRITAPPSFKKNVNVLDNLRIGMYSNVNYFFDTNTRKFYANVYKLSESYTIMNHSGDDNPPEIPNGLQDSPSRLMVRMLDNGQMDKSGKLESPDKRMELSRTRCIKIQLTFQSDVKYNSTTEFKFDSGGCY